ncbi:hypothetical protein CYMTET_19875 [Cymbomonas tetramitiformis]|uniref:Uncharacterized protein n=1 Tax=Cymbomonas tetramitiformis TaxID=36881 RepID=A0AAE0G5T4_9CHLO|nr:hypothetical protein CYMTET_19875 [Cymbomonas tetramitiformis]
MEMQERTQPWLFSDGIKNSLTNQHELPPASKHGGPFHLFDKRFEEQVTGRFDAQKDDVYEQPNLGLRPAHSKVGKTGGPDPYNLSGKKHWIEVNKRTNTFPPIQAKGRGAFDADRTGWMRSEPTFVQHQLNSSVTAQRSISPVKKHPAISGPTRERYKKNLATAPLRDLKSTHNFKDWIKRGPSSASCSFKGSITCTDPMRR